MTLRLFFWFWPNRCFSPIAIWFWPSWPSYHSLPVTCNFSSLFLYLSHSCYWNNVLLTGQQKSFPSPVNSSHVLLVGMYPRLFREQHPNFSLEILQLQLCAVCLSVKVRCPLPKVGPKASPPLYVLEAQTLVTRRAIVPGGGALRKYCSVLHAWLSTQPAQGLPGLSGTGLLHLHLLYCSNPSWTLLLVLFSFLARVGLCRLQSESSVIPHLKPLLGVISETVPPCQASPSVCGLLFLL